MGPHAFSVHSQAPPPHVQVLQPSPATFVSPSVHSHAIRVQAHSPSKHEHVLQPSPAGFTSPSLQTGSQAICVQAQSPSLQTQVLQPSPAGRVAPSVQGIVDVSIGPPHATTPPTIVQKIVCRTCWLRMPTN